MSGLLVLAFGMGAEYMGGRERTVAWEEMHAWVSMKRQNQEYIPCLNLRVRYET